MKIQTEFDSHDSHVPRETYAYRQKIDNSDKETLQKLKEKVFCHHPYTYSVSAAAIASAEEDSILNC